MKNMQSELTLLRDSWPERPEMGPAVSRVLMDEVAAGERGATIRLSRPGRVVAFGRRDCTSPGYPEAVAGARSRGFEAMERIAGGRAAAYTEGTLSLTFTIPDAEPARRTSARFEYAATVARDALVALGVDARIGEVEGEYCPGAFSVNAEGRRKLIGIGQRMIKGAAHVGFVIAVRDAETVRDVLDPVYRGLGLDWNPETVGAIDQDLPSIGLETVEQALLARLANDALLTAGSLEPDTVRSAEAVADRFRSP
jgi:lipoate-protein ligase A